MISRIAPSTRRAALAAVAALLSIALFAARQAGAQDGAEGLRLTVLVNGRVHTMTGAVHDPGYVVIQGREIIAVGDMGGVDGDFAVSDSTTRLDLEGLDVYPGWFAAQTQLGMVEIDMVGSVNDTSEGTSLSSPQLRVIDAINAESSLIGVSRMTGVTTAAVVPGGQVINGQGAIITLGGGSIDECLIESPSALYVDFGEAARTGDSKRPETRMGVMGVFREEFTAAREYAEKWDRHREETARWEQKVAKYNEEKEAAENAPDMNAADGDDAEGEDEPKDPGLAPAPPSTDLAKEVLASALRGDLLVVARANRLDDIDSALRLRDEFGLRMAIVGATNAYKMADKLAAAGMPLLISATENPNSMEKQGARYTNAARLHEAGVEFAIIPEDANHNVRNLPFEAGLAVTYGLPHDVAVAAITSTPAKIFGVGDKVGSIAPGHVASIVVVEGDPLQPTSHVRHLFIAGEEVALESRQTRLAAPYLARYLGDD